MACVGLVSEGQGQLIPRKYARDVVFYLISVVYLCVIFFDGVVSTTDAFLAVVSMNWCRIKRLMCHAMV